MWIFIFFDEPLPIICYSLKALQWLYQVLSYDYVTNEAGTSNGGICLVDHGINACRKFTEEAKTSYRAITSMLLRRKPTPCEPWSLVWELEQVSSSLFNQSHASFRPHQRVSTTRLALEGLHHCDHTTDCYIRSTRTETSISQYPFTGCSRASVTRRSIPPEYGLRRLSASRHIGDERPTKDDSRKTRFLISPTCLPSVL